MQTSARLLAQESKIIDKDQVIIALDNLGRDNALALAKELKGLVWGFKVNDLLIDCGVEILKELKQHGKVFADPKLYDIPNTVANSVAKLDKAGADLITVHASGGRKMIEAAKNSSSKAKILAVTVLTSFSTEECEEVYQQESDNAVLTFAKLAKSAGADGIVCSPRELALLSNNSELTSLTKVTPGVRPSKYEKSDDQRRVATPEEAINSGANYIVIGRPITEADSPKAAVEALLS